MLFQGSQEAYAKTGLNEQGFYQEKTVKDNREETGRQGELSHREASLGQAKERGEEGWVKHPRL